MFLFSFRVFRYFRVFRVLLAFVKRSPEFRTPSPRRSFVAPAEARRYQD
jgi:hypothetical protein